MTITFPDGFVWGTSTAAHQTEGGNWNNDWWAWEHAEGTACAEPSGDAVDHYWRYPDDIRLLRELGFGAYRFSVEWSRIEPEDGEFSRAALEHYRRMLATCHEHDVVPVVTFHHFTTPRWVAHHGGWEEPDTADRFARFCERATKHLGERIGTACTINEPNMVATGGYLSGGFPPGRQDAALRRAVNDIFCDAHRKAYDAIKGVRPELPTGLTLAMQSPHPVDGGEPGQRGYYADRYYRDGRYYQERALGRNDRIYRGRNNRYYCRRNDGTTGLVVGGLAGGALGNVIAGGGSRLLGTLIGAGGGALLGQSVDRGNVRCR